jgi:hypothetical protein
MSTDTTTDTTTITTMKLSAAMRRGIQIVPEQAFGANIERIVSEDEERTVTYRVCARGAAYIGAHPEIASTQDLHAWDECVRGAGRNTFRELFGYAEGDEPYTWLPMEYEPGPGAVLERAELSSGCQPGTDGELLDLVVTLNDHWRWPVAKIADWLEAQGY